VKLGEILIRSQYGISKKADNNGKGVAILRMGNIRNGYLDMSDMKHIDLNEDEFKKYCLKDGDILINRTNSLELVGKAAVFEGVKKDCVFASYLIRLQVDESRALPQFVSSVINSRVGRSYILHTARRAIGMVNINAQEIARMPISLPPISEQKKLVASMFEARHILTRLMESMTKKAVQAIPGAILQKAFAGEL
jgi:type I restriction enzyme S subunit